MIEEIARDLYRISVPLPDSPLKELNSYFIRGAERDLLIDTGFRCEECRQALGDGLRELGSAADRRDVFITHLHFDHIGMADLFVGKDCHIFLSKTDLDYMHGLMYGDTKQIRRGRFLQEGFPEELLRYIEHQGPAWTMTIPQITSRFQGLLPGDKLLVGDYCLRMLLVPGHTPGNTMLWAENQGIMFTGDHVLFDITPNITAWLNIPDSLGNYLDSLRYARSFPVRLALPGHRKSGAYHERIDTLLLHHDMRLQEILRIIKSASGLTAYEITGRMKWRIRARNWDEFPAIQKWFAVGECLAHLDYLLNRGGIYREYQDDVWYYRISGN